MTAPEKLPMGAMNPLLTEARRTADATGIRVISGPHCLRGFRLGWWTVERDGTTAQVYASAPDAATEAEANAMVAHTASLAFAIRDLRARGYPEADAF